MITYGELFRNSLKKIENNDAWALLSFLLEEDRTKIALKFGQIAQDSICKQYDEMVQKRMSGMPIAYITREKEFYSLKFKVNESVLIPRPDTELLVDCALKSAKNKKVLDLCCGSGCIGISIASNVSCMLTLADISAESLKIAEINAKKHGIEAEILKIDILKDEIPGKYGLVVSNPPYIETGVIETLQEDVKNFEPRIALDGGRKGLDFYPVIAEKAYNSLENGGVLAAEIGFNQASDVREIFSKYYKNISVLRDFGGNDRVVIGIKR